MKLKLLLAVVCVMSSTSLFAAKFDEAFFGGSLNGFNKRGGAVYSIDKATYSTARPTITKIKGGGLFISTKVNKGSAGFNRNQSIIEMTVSSKGQVVALQIRSVIDGKEFSTQLVERQPADIYSYDEGAAAPEEYFTPTQMMVNEVFAQFDAALLATQPKEPVPRSLFSRIFGNKTGTTRFPAAVRHNVQLLLRSVR